MPNFLEELKSKCDPNARLYVSTDVELLFLEMQETIKKTGHWEPINKDPFWEKEYKTHWHKYSVTDDRTLFYESYQFKK